jgi:hypothetical protein
MRLALREGELANFSRESLIEWIDLCFLPWKDDKDDDFSGDFYAAIDNARSYIDECTAGMKFRFHKWIRTLGLPKGHKYKKLSLDENAFYIKFNYTDCVSNILSRMDKTSMKASDFGRSI